MSHSTDIESPAHPEGLQEIRSWASRSPGSARPGFRIRQPRVFRRAPRFAASALLAAIVLLVSLAGFRFLQIEQDSPRQAAIPALDPAVPELEEVLETAEAPPAPLPTEEEVIVPDRLQARTEPLRVHAIPAVQQAPRERPLQAAAVVVRREPVPHEPEASSAIVLGRNAFESEPAVLLSVPAAEYPEVARGTGTSAEVIVGFTVDETGAVRNPVIDRTRIQGDAPKAPFEQAALTAAYRALFEPARERGVPARSWSTLTFSFEAGAPGV